MEFSTEILLILFFVGILAGIIDTIAGGGGLITIPALLFAGMPPATALGTNKLQSVFGTFTASLYFIRKKMIKLKDMKLMIIIAFCSSIFGGWALLKIDSSLLIKIVPILLILIGIFFLLSKDIGKVEKHKIVSTVFFTFTFIVIISFYDGFFGPGTGSFFTIAFIYLLGNNILQATAQTKILNFATNLGSLLIFSFLGEIYLWIGLVMGFGQIIGATIGAKLVISKGQKLIRPLVVIISFAMSFKLLFYS
ncbi:TSUP family transporter [Sulfurimonas sp.]|uniref:TSUP family transporter n=1 Tax=Sulfurimonas sp. TaxID=2022749 RepID=UPI002B498863|nr:TSUP family transporter [Sulfurimonas sp.]